MFAEREPEKAELARYARLRLLSAALSFTLASYVTRTNASTTGRLGRQPNASCRSAGTGPLPLVADSVRKLTILDIGSNMPA